ncbi:DUF1816 domain-containing protein [Pseudanabaena galeata UHCC 0370]|jgi:NADPH-dependent 2,4-dienoyl-CoA reductase/sulfur reductase-like enzyme|uniref:DUF1816 domain-containing protein n=1 Tax=Pseudanabaena galeata UHCC 0370 TaxID=3110310 RepID=A0ABU5TNE6_9CYAN|nr:MULTISPECIES: DUF1816 domain-containing protein [Pseudanabaena]MEA5479857.1 DUF1816 domain-containing protein [Pseudanabaena galeata UHCC 0370]MEA5486290.1 DUF1816 domain-containing protein [Pseudanabaena sp. CCNP1317]WGS71601.1 DUF1816 domain-containing protein [Pseudanabaena galeata CCNP1313]
MGGNLFKNIFTSILETFGLAVWIEIVTDSPHCTYYFGPFTSAAEAESAKVGYIEDLEAEGSKGLAITVKRCKPENLTVYDDSLDFKFDRFLVFSGQT